MFATSLGLRKAELSPFRCLRTGESEAMGRSCPCYHWFPSAVEAELRQEWSVDLAQVAQNTGDP